MEERRLDSGGNIHDRHETCHDEVTEFQVEARVPLAQSNLDCPHNQFSSQLSEIARALTVATCFPSSRPQKASESHPISHHNRQVHPMREASAPHPEPTTRVSSPAHSIIQPSQCRVPTLNPHAAHTSISKKSPGTNHARHPLSLHPLHQLQTKDRQCPTQIIKTKSRTSKSIFPSTHTPCTERRPCQTRSHILQQVKQNRSPHRT